MAKLAIIISFVNEYPLIATTIRSIGEALIDTDVDFEVIAVDNWMPEVGEQRDTKTGLKFGKDRGHSLVESLSAAIPWLKVVHYHDKLSHWNAKNFGATQTDADILMFMDAHCIAPIKAMAPMAKFYGSNWYYLRGSLHLPLTYHILEEKRLIYSMRWRPELADLDYTFTAARDVADSEYYEVPCMSTCGMMIHRTYMNQLGWWPSALGIYGGGEHWLNYTMAIVGMKKWIWGNRPLYHHGDSRGYRWNALDYERNRLIAIYLWGTVQRMVAFAEKRNFPSKRLLYDAIDEISNNLELDRHKKLIDAKRLMDIEEFVGRWQNA